jgi:hypothetical protein
LYVRTNVITLILCRFACAGLLLAQKPADPPAAVSLSLFFENGAMKPITFYGNPARYLNEIDVVFTTSPQSLDDGIDSLIKSTSSSALDWRGVKMVDEDWRMSGDGTFQRQRFYRNAAWMNAASQFRLYASDAQGKRLGAPITASAGRDDQSAESDDFFVRRFTVRQIATGCKKLGDCTGAKFVSQQLLEVRYNRHAAAQAAVLPPQTAALELEWSQNSSSIQKVAVKRAAADSAPYGYGFQVSLDVISPPANHSYFVPGETVKLRATFRDGAGRRLHDPGTLPTYGQFMRDEVASGLRYYDPQRVNSTVYYALKHREGNILVSLAGPTGKLRQAKSRLDGRRLADPQTVVAAVAPDGYTGLFTGLPSFAISVGGAARWNDPGSDTVSFTIPTDAQPGTYVAAIKARRVFGGEALNRAATTLLQVGTTTPTKFTPATVNCQNCHQGASGFDRILHGVTDRRACFACHIALSFEDDNALDYRVHAIHSRSRRFGADAQNCSICHLTRPSAPARGLLAGAGFAAAK